MTSGADDSARRAVFRCDASVVLGGGHVRRCLTLAEALRGRGWEVIFAVDRATLPVFPRLTDRIDGFVVVDGTEDDEALRIGERVGRCDVVVVDHYHRDARFERACRSFAHRIVVIDDLADRPHDADVLIDPAPGRSPGAGAVLAQASTRMLSGPQYAPLRPAFPALRQASLGHRATGDRVGRILIALGSTDADNHTGRALAAVAASRLPATIDVVLGANAPHLAAVRRQAASIGCPVRVWVDTDQVAELMVAADLAIGAGGTGSWERCCLGLPTIVLITADNQRLTAESLAAAGAAVIADAAPDGAGGLAAAIGGLAGNPDRRRKMSRAAAVLCDGRGTERILMQLEPELTRERTPVVLRPVVAGDRELMLAWQAHPRTRRYAFTRRAPTRAEHNRWCVARLADPDCLFSLILAADMPVGVVRLDRRHQDGIGDCYEVSIFVGPRCHGLGFGTAGLRLARRLVAEATLVARINDGNRSSVAAFNRAGYHPYGDVLVNVPIDCRCSRPALPYSGDVRCAVGAG